MYGVHESDPTGPNPGAEAAAQKRLVRWFSRKQYAVPLVAALALLAIGLNELTYSRTIHAMHVSGSIAQARIAATGVLQLLSDAEIGQRGYVLAGHTEYLLLLDATKVQLLRMRDPAARALTSSGADGQKMASQMSRAIQDSVAEIDETITLEQAGEHTSAVRTIESGQSRKRMEDMRHLFDTGLSETTIRQDATLASVFDALWMNRVGVTLLTLMGAISLGFYLRHLRLFDEEREVRERNLGIQVEERTAELRQLAGYLLTAREDEKAHLARELHDELGALLTSAKLDMARLRKRLAETSGAQEIIEQVIARLNEGIALKRRIVEDLRPSSLDVLGLSASLGALCAEAGSRLGIPVTTDMVEVALSPDGNLAIYRMVQEGLTNVGKYAQASHVAVAITSDSGMVHVRVEDDGIGFELDKTKPGAHGIAGMRLRFEALNGTMSVLSAPGAGTRLEATLPRHLVE